MQVSAWHGGGSTFGIRVGKQNRDRYFHRDWESIKVVMDGRLYTFALTDGFWRDCPEFRDRGTPVIKAWLQKHKSIPWNEGQPPRMELIPVEGNTFRLESEPGTAGAHQGALKFVAIQPEQNHTVFNNRSSSVNANDIQSALDLMFHEAERKGLSQITVVSRTLHRKVGQYPGPNHRMPMCCNVMRQAMKAGDAIVNQPPKGNGATLEIKYQLPR